MYYLKIVIIIIKRKPLNVLIILNIYVCDVYKRIPPWKGTIKTFNGFASLGKRMRGR